MTKFLLLIAHLLMAVGALIAFSTFLWASISFMLAFIERDPVLGMFFLGAVLILIGFGLDGLANPTNIEVEDAA